MTVSSGYAPNSSTANGVTTVFPYNFLILAAADLEVTVDGVVKTLTTDYSVSGVGTGSGGNVTFVVAPANGAIVIRRRNMALARGTDYQDNGDLLADVLNPDQDSPVLMVQQLQEQINRSLKLPLGESTSVTLPALAARAGKVLVFDGSGNAGVGVDNFAALASAADASASAAAGSAGAAAGSAAASGTSARAAAASEAGAAAVALGNFTQSGTGAGVRTFLAKARDFVSILDFIPVAQHAAIKDRSTTYDCYGDIVNAINSQTQGSGTYISGPRIYFPPGLYICNTKIELKRAVTLVGEHSGLPFATNSTLRFPAGVTGIVVNHNNTLNGGVEGVPTTSAAGTIIEGLQIEGGGGATAHGIWLRARALIRNCLITGFSGNGIRVYATTGGGGSIEGNANNFHLDGGRIQSCGSHGIYVEGADANAGLIQTIDLSANSGWGVYDHSFLGNTYIACHTATNTLGAYKSDNINARNLFLNCYSEGDQPTSSFVAPAFAIGGLHGAGITGSYIIVDGTGPWASQITARSTDGNFQATLGPSFGGTNCIFEISGVGASTTNFSPWRLKAAMGKAYYDWGNVAGSDVFVFYDRNSVTVAHGFARDLTNWSTDTTQAGAPPGLPLGYMDKGMRARITSNAAPTTGPWLRGDIVYNELPSAGGFIGWVCTTAGSPGTWKTFGVISP